ncbi:hypothetical protein H8958_007441, partial [Nasalis larvatus]
VPKDKALEATKLAIEVGFRHVDCAHIYNNEAQVGLAIRSKIADGSVKREDIFYTSKLWSNSHRPQLVQSALERSLKNLQLDYVDLYLIHFPVSLKLKRGIATDKIIGAEESNPGEELIPKDENGKVLFDTVDLCATWEVECHPYLNQRKLLDFCKSKDIVLVAYSALGSHREEQWVDQNSPVLLKDPVLCALAKKHKRTPALIALRYQLQRGIVVLAKSYNEQRIRENMKVFEFQLTSEDMKAIDGLDRNIRYLTPDTVSKGEELIPKDENGEVLFDTLDLCATWDVSATRVDPNSPVLLEDPILCALAKKHKRTPALTALRYQLQHGVVVLAKSHNEQRIRENMKRRSGLCEYFGI